MAHAGNPSTWEVKVGESDDQGHSWLHSELEVDLGYTVSTLSLNIKRTEKVQGAFADARKACGSYLKRADLKQQVTCALASPPSSGSLVDNTRRASRVLCLHPTAGLLPRGSDLVPSSILLHFLTSL